jgi:hypothetical protein
MNYSYAPQSVQAVVPTAGNATNSALMPQANSLQQPVVQQPLNTTTPPQLQQIQQQYVSQIPTTATPTAPVDRLGSIDTSTVGGINDFVAAAYQESQKYTQVPQAQVQAVAPAVAPQAVQPAQQVQPASTPVAQTVNTQVAQTQQQQQMTTVQPTANTATQNQLAYNPQTTAQQPQTPTEGMSDGKGNIVMRNRQTGQFEWRRQEDVLAMYQAGKGTGGSVQLPDGTWAKKTTVDSATAKITARLKLKELLDQGKITPDDFKLAGGDQDLSGILGSTQQTKNAKALARMKEAASGPRDIAELGGASPYSSFTSSAGGGSETG